MSYNFKSVDRETAYLLPPNMREWLPVNHLNKKINREPSALGKLLAFSLACLIPKGALADSLTLTTWYPAPYGVYTKLRSTQDAYFAYQGGKVGIGTTNPGALIEGSNSTMAAPNTMLRLSNRAWANWDFNIPGAAYNGLQPGSLAIMPGVGNTDFGIGSQVSPMAFVVKNTGLIGIGTTNPQSLLDVHGRIENSSSDGAFMRFTKTLPTPGSSYMAWKNNQGIDIAYIGYTGSAPNPAFVVQNMESGGDMNLVGARNVLLLPSASGAVGIATQTPDDGSGQIKLNIWSPSVNGAVLKVADRGGNSRVDYSPSTAILYVGRDANAGRSINAAGTINANGADYAEWIPWVGTKPNPGTIIEFKGSYLVVSSTNTAAFTGNDRHSGKDSILVAFVGQIPVLVKGKVKEGDYIIPGSDGAGRAIDADHITFDQYKKAIGKAWEASGVDEIKRINVALGVK